MGAIYKIVNSINDKVYVGKTIYSIDHRWKRHLIDCRRKERAYRSHLYDAMNKYGVDKFRIELIEECEDSVLDERERYWIKSYDSIRNGYNLTHGGEGYNIIGEEEEENIIRLWKRGDVTREETAIASGVSSKTVQRVLYKNGVTKKDIYSRAASRSRDRNSKPVYCYDLEGNFLKEYPSERAMAKDLGISHTTIGHVLHGRQKSLHGMMIRDFKSDKIDKISRKFSSDKIEVHQYSLDGEYIRSYKSMLEASKSVGLRCTKTIKIACNVPRKTGAGYLWRLYKTDRIEPICKKD